MTIAYGLTSSGNTGTGTATSLSPTVPGGANVGDVAVLAVVQNGTQAITGPAGWTQQAQATTSGNNCRITVFTKVLAGGEPGSTLSVSFAGAQRACWSVSTLTGSLAYDVSATNTNNTQSSSLVAPSVTPTKPNSMWLALVAARNSTVGSTPTFTPPGGMTEQVDQSTNNGANVNIAQTVGSQFVAAASPTGTATFTPSVQCSFAAVSLTVSPTPVQGAAALSAHGDLGADGRVEVQGAAALSAHGDLGASGHAIDQGGVLLSGHGDLGATGKVREQGTVTLSGHGALGASGTVVYRPTAAMSGHGDLTAAGHAVAEGGVLLSGHGDLGATGKTVQRADTALSAHGDLTVAGTGVGHGTANLSAHGNLDAAGNLVVNAATALSGHGDLDATAQSGPPGVFLGGHGDITATGTVLIHADTALSGHGDLTAAGTTTPRGAAHLAGAGTLTATAHDTTRGAADLSGRSRIQATGTTPTAPDPVVEPLLDHLLACLCAAMADHPRPPAVCCHRVGDHVTYGQPECCAGVAWVRQVNTAPTDDASFPEPAMDLRMCGSPIRQWAVTVELGVARCAPTQTPTQLETCAQWEEATGLGFLDAAALRRAVCCVPVGVQWDDLVVLSLEPGGPQGGCQDVRMMIAVKVVGCDEC